MFLKLPTDDEFGGIADKVKACAKGYNYNFCNGEKVRIATYVRCYLDHIIALKPMDEAPIGTKGIACTRTGIALQWAD